MLTIKAYWRKGGMAPIILNLGTSFRWVVTFTPPGKRPRHPNNRKPRRPQNRSGFFFWGGGSRKVPCPSQQSNHRPSVVQPGVYQLYRLTGPQQQQQQPCRIRTMWNRKLKSMGRYLRLAQQYCWIFKSSVSLRHVDWQIFTDVYEHCIAFVMSATLYQSTRHNNRRR